MNEIETRHRVEERNTRCPHEAETDDSTPSSVIETKRKELEDKIKELEIRLSNFSKEKQNTIIYENVAFEYKMCKCALLNLNLGGEMARKEFIKILDEQSEKDICPHCSATLKQSYYCDCCQERVSVSCECLNLMEELKQSLEENKK